MHIKWLQESYSSVEAAVDIFSISGSCPVFSHLILTECLRICCVADRLPIALLGDCHVIEVLYLVSTEASFSAARPNK